MKEKEIKKTFKDEKYWKEVDPKTGNRYIIPGLLTTDPKYMQKYINYMKLKEKNFNDFLRIINWE